MTNNHHLIGSDVDVYFNLHRKCWSVRDRHTRRVVAHTHQIVLSDVTFRVSAAGNARVRREGRKNVHAFARGTVQSIGVLFTIEQSVGVTYNPYKYTTFVNADTERPVHGALLAGFSGRSVLALDPTPSPVKGYRGMTRAVQAELTAPDWKVPVDTNSLAEVG